MVSVTPAILTHSLDTCVEQMMLMKDVADMIHIDILDGTFVDRHTFSLKDLQERIHTEQVSQAIELHLMVDNPERYVKEIMGIAHITQVIVHAEACTHLDLTIRTFHKEKIKVGVSYPFDILPTIKHQDMDYFLVLSEENIGYSGKSFAMESLRQIEYLAKEFPKKEIAVDGGINDITGKTCLRAGAKRLIATSYLFSSEDPLMALQSLQQLDYAW